MKGKLELHLLSGTYEEYNLIEDFDTNNTYVLNCYINLELPIEKIFNNNTKLKKDIIKQYIELLEESNEQSKLNQIFYKYFNEDFDLLNNCESITLVAEDEDIIIKYLKDNPILLTKKVMIDTLYKLEDFMYVKEKYKDFPNLYFYIEGNKEPINIIDYEKTVNTINDIISKIKRFNFSPLEQLMYAYDLIRTKVYNEEKEEESQNLSRDLTSVLLGDKIVCVGYANIFEKVVAGLGIKVQQHRMINKNHQKTGHRINIVYINDEKYDINGIYYFDLTWNSKTNEIDNNYLNSYLFFAKTKKQIDKYYQCRYQDNTFKALSEELISKTEELLKKDNVEKLTSYMMISINEISRFIDDIDLFELRLNFPIPEVKKRAIERFDKEETIKKLRKYNNLFDKPLSANILLQALYNVRKIEYYENPEKYAFDFKTISTIAYNSHWNFEGENETIFLNAIFESIPVIAPNFNKKIEEYSNETKLEKNINQVRLTKVLRNIKDKKENN